MSLSISLFNLNIFIIVVSNFVSLFALAILLIDYTVIITAVVIAKAHRVTRVRKSSRLSINSKSLIYNPKKST